ncbi:MAG: lysylphosphatidylglycerol synthase transmembrane domain-containing protein [Bacteroidota bacterium]
MTSGNKNSSFRKLGSYLLPVLFTFVFLFLAFKDIDLAKSIRIITQSSLIWLVIYVLVFYLSHYIRVIRWKVIIKPIKPDTSQLHLFGAVMIGYGVNCIIPRLGEIYRGMFLGKWEGLSRTSMVGTVIIERIIDILFFALASLISVLLFPGNLFEEISWLKTSLIIGFAFIILFFVLLILMVKFEKKFSNSLIKIISKFSKTVSTKLSDLFSTLIDGISTIRNLKSILIIVLLTAVMLLTYALNAYVGFYMLHLEKEVGVSFVMAWVLMTISSYGVVIPTPGGTGSYHIIAILVLTQLYNFSSEISAAYALLTHLISYIIFIGTTLIIILVINRIRVKNGFKSENFISVFNINSETK